MEKIMMMHLYERSMRTALLAISNLHAMRSHRCQPARFESVAVPNPDECYDVVTKEAPSSSFYNPAQFHKKCSCQPSITTRAETPLARPSFVMVN
jgi:hypothetical protein